MTVMSYFARERENFQLWHGFENGRGLRECQMGAYWAVWSHFTVSKEPALVSVPTGAGKTALMIALAFAFKAKRVLVITPAEVLRDQTARDFESLGLFKELGIVARNMATPRVLSNGSQLRTKHDWNQLAPYDVVTATPKTVSSKEHGICNPPLELFDLVFLDEAHHSPAVTWSAVIEDFATSKRVLLTATLT